MDIEMHQLDLRYQDLRRRHPARERHLLASLVEVGQQLPIVVVRDLPGFVVIDGYKRVRALRALARDGVRATCWELDESEALLLDQLMRRGGEDALEQAWLLAELNQRFGLSCQQLAQRFDRSKSWVSRRLGLVAGLPVVIQQQVRTGALAAHAAMKCLLPLARANPDAAIRLAQNLVPLAPSTRQVACLYAGWQAGSQATRELIEGSPQIYLRAQESLRSRPAVAPSPQQRRKR
jgi:ParB/RepB/Spo0J family partition protein